MYQQISRLKIKFSDCEFLEQCLKIYYENLPQYSGYTQEEIGMEARLRLDIITLNDFDNIELRNSIIKETIQILKNLKNTFFETESIYDILSGISGLPQVMIRQIDENMNPGRYYREIEQQNIFKEKKPSGYSRPDTLFLQRLDSIIEKNIPDPDSGIEKILKEMNISRAQLYRKLNQLKGCSVNEYIKAARIKKGLQMLLNGEKTISEISYAVGFNSPSYFTSTFKKIYGFSPGKYLKTLTQINQRIYNIPE